MTRIKTAALTASFVATIVGSAALAHPRLLQTTPTANATVAGPGKIELKFSEPLIRPMTGADVAMIGMPGKPHHAPFKMSGFTPTLSADRKTFTLTGRRLLPVGTYRVAWHAVSVDTHRVQGSFAFAVK